MCGIAGFFSASMDQEDAMGTLNNMAAKLEHRGPDSDGFKLLCDGKIGLAHKRLAIIDLSPAGEQPMASPSNRYKTVYNGEVYNYLELRKDLPTPSKGYKGHSDTEVVLNAFDQYGINETLPKLTGMFAFAIWDEKTKTLTLARDRVGEKPLYYSVTKNGDFVFGSELKAIEAFPTWRQTICRKSLAVFMRHSYIPAPHTIYENTWKLSPGHFMQISFAEDIVNVGKQQSFWSAKDVWNQEKIHLSDDDAVSTLEKMLRETIKGQMISDVPLGTFLSGGIDSSIVTAIAQSISNKPVNSFSIGFHEDDYNEAEHAKRVANHLGTNHTELYVTAKEAQDVIPSLSYIYDEPFADSSQIPTFLVAKLARTKVTVALSGDGGDEIFGGYNRYFWAERIWGTLRYLPPSLRKLIADSLTAVSCERWTSMASALGKVIKPLGRHQNVGDKVHKIAGFLTERDRVSLYKNLVSQWRNPNEILIDGQECKTVLSAPEQWPDTKNFSELMMYLDLISYLPGDILAKVDRATMAVSLESRVPLLDHRIIEFAAKLPVQQKIRDGQGKWLLRQVLSKYVPDEIINRPKMGFGVPIGSWLRGPLKVWAEDLLNSQTLSNQGYYDVKEVRKKWSEHISGKRNWQYQLWSILMFQSWLSK